MRDRLQIYQRLRTLGRLPALVRWLAAGCATPPPQDFKIAVVGAYLRRFGLGRFIETGTYRGDTLMQVARQGIDCVSIELSERLHREALERFRGWPNVRLIQGDSGKLLPELLASLDAPALFWLDGHYSGGITARGEQDSPVWQELQAIHDHPVPGHVVLIDDARCFTGAGGYPRLEELLGEVRARGRFRAEVSTDVIRLTPPEPQPAESHA